MADDFCGEHGYEHMVFPKHWAAIPYCAECDRLQEAALDNLRLVTKAEGLKMRTGLATPDKD